MEIGLDFDGVMIDCGKLKTEGAKKLYGLDIPPEKFKKEIVIGEGLLTLDQYRELQSKIYGTRELGLLMELVDGVLEYLPKLQKSGKKIRIVTSREDLGSQIAKELMEQNRLTIPLIGVGYGNPKTEACKGLDVYVDDDLDKLEPLIDVVPHRFLFTWGYNEHIEVEPGIAERVSSWKELYEKIICIK